LGGERSIFIITDFGDSPYTGILRSVIKGINPDVEIIDIDNSVPSYSVLAGAYVVYNTYKWTPRGSVILTVVDPGVGGSREAVIVEAGDYVFVGPNNGVLYPAIAAEGFRRGISILPERVSVIAAKYFRGKLESGKWTVSSTFHGRDVFAPAASLYALGVEMGKLGTPIGFEDLRRTIIDQVERVPEGYRLKVVYIDKFGNVALSSKAGLIPIRHWREVTVATSNSSFRAVVGRKFSDVPPGGLLLYVNSFGFLELAVNMGSAAKKLGVSIGDRIVISPV